MPKPPASALVHITPQTHHVVIDMMYASPRNFTGKTVYGFTECLLHPQAEVALRKAAAAAKGFGFTLKIFDAYRPQEAQEALWAHLPDPHYVADPAVGSNHTRGVALDLTLLDAHGNELDMGTPVDTMTPASHHFYPALSAAVMLNRMHLLTIMLEAGFVHHPYEWWHYQLADAHRFELIGDEAFEACLAAAAS
ncbi:MAG: D-alanyl-D-alanine dipeptidase [Polaromonas sp.]|uniref:D-alanyl-D-alanine dipeptidase n=1 Tax=Polaromonas sp. TaxID=1869339 RepID=UPI0025E35B4E|nr:D-alanyl-D-alanine dipeptidase [Polaromonas sp.]MBI2728185.1 D-alanyl-D-alanine dipeptidase [Polaromonas sp.]